MECSKRITISEHFLSHRTKILSGFTLGLLASLVFLTLLFFNSSFKIPKLQVFLQGSQFNRNSSSSSFSSWHFPFSTFSSNSDSNHSVTPLHTFDEEQQSLARDLNVSNKGLEKGKTNLGNFTDNLLDRGRVDKVGNFSAGKTNLGNFTENSLDRNGDAKVGNFSVGKGNSSVSVAVEKSVERIDEKCDIFDGNWVRDESKPYYPLGSCPFVDRDFDCHLNGRPDSDYVKWKWKPSKCDIPRYVYVSMILINVFLI